MLLAVVLCRHIREITQNLPVDLDANIAAEFVFDENYWKRRCIEHFLQRNCQISEHGLTWKQLYFENYLQKVLFLLSHLHSSLRRASKNTNQKQKMTRYPCSCEPLKLVKTIFLLCRYVYFFIQFLDQLITDKAAPSASRYGANLPSGLFEIHTYALRELKQLPNLTKLDVTYGVKKIGMKYDRMLFGMKVRYTTNIFTAAACVDIRCQLSC